MSLSLDVNDFLKAYGLSREEVEAIIKERNLPYVLDELNRVPDSLRAIVDDYVLEMEHARPLRGARKKLKRAKNDEEKNKKVSKSEWKKIKLKQELSSKYLNNKNAIWYVHWIAPTKSHGYAIEIGENRNWKSIFEFQKILANKKGKRLNRRDVNYLKKNDFFIGRENGEYVKYISGIFPAFYTAENSRYYSLCKNLKFKFKYEQKTADKSGLIGLKIWANNNGKISFSESNLEENIQELAQIRIENLLLKHQVSTTEVILIKTLYGIEEIRVSWLEKVLNDRFIKDKGIIELHKSNAEGIDFINKWWNFKKEDPFFEEIIETYPSGIIFKGWLLGGVPFELLAIEPRILILASLDLEFAVESEEGELITKAKSGQFREVFAEIIRCLLENKSIRSQINGISKDAYVFYMCLCPEYIEETRELSNFLFGLLSNRGQLDLLDSNLDIDVPLEFAEKNFQQLNSSAQENLAAQLSDEALVGRLKQIKRTNSKEFIKRIHALNHSLFIKDIDFMVFDLEASDKELYEIGWVRNNEEKLFVEDGVGEGLMKFQSAIDDQVQFIVGHNIRMWDVPILERKGVNFGTIELWDTLEVEQLLSSNQRSFALKTYHTALLDAKKARELFWNQIKRLIVADGDGIFDYLPDFIFEIVSALRKKICLHVLSVQNLEEKKREFYRPQYGLNKTMKKLMDKVQKISNREIYVIGNEEHLRDIICLAKVYLQNGRSEIEAQVISKAKFDQVQLSDSIINGAIRQFLLYCEKNRDIPYYGNLSHYVRKKIENYGLNPWDLFESSKSSGYPRFITTNELRRFGFENKNIDEIEVIVIESNLLSITDKELEKELDISEFLQLNSDDNLWMKFSGGQSAIELIRPQLSDLGVNNIDDLRNYWIEKYAYGKYKIWSSYPLDRVLKKLNIKKPIILKNQNEKLIEALYFPRIEGNQNCDFHYYPCNPQSIYRPAYWLYVKEVIQKISTNKVPCILFIQNDEEINQLIDYFKDLGFYIPATEASLARRIELLHENVSSRCMVILSIRDYRKCLDVNYLGSVQLIVESLDLHSVPFISEGSEFFKEIVKSTNLEELDNSVRQLDDKDDSNDGDPIDPKNFLVQKRDMFIQIALQYPRIYQMVESAVANDVDNTIWILDPRFADFSSLVRGWGGKFRDFQLWSREEDYKSDLKDIQEFIQGPVIKDSELDLKRSKQIMANVFLDEGCYWFEEQEPYLDEIIPRHADIMVSLPTGNGKSLLFQAPALLNSCFTNRATIVVTPLKALMEDQVENLWKRGFYGSVEYLNSDRRLEQNQIYRSFAGGEISMLYVTPERFRSKAFLSVLTRRLETDGALEYFVFDEAHCVSQWGHEFRPDYFNCARSVHKIRMSAEERTPLVLLSATVSERIFKDIEMIFS